MSAITAKASRKMKKYAVLTREPRCFLGSFDFSWEQRKLTEFVEFFSGLTYTPNDVQENGTLVLRSSNVSNGEVVDADNIYVNPQVVNSENVKVGDIVVVVRNGSRSLIGKHAQIKAFMPNTVIGAFMTGIRSECPEFTNALLNTSRFEEEIAMNMGATINQITGYMFSKMEFKMPCLDEQKKIGEYFEKLDNLITLHQRKCVFLFGLFQASISMIFTASTFSWEQRKLGDIGKARSGVGFPDAEQGGVTGIPFFKVSDMNLDGNENEMTVANNYVTAEQIAVHRWSPITELPAIFFAKVGAAVMLNRKRLCRFPFLLDNNTMAYSLSSTKWDADFAKALFGTVDLTSLVQVGALPSYNAGDVESMEIYLPSLLEQEQIGGFFKQLDTLITLHQRECISFTVRAGGLILTANKKRTTSSWEQRKLSEMCGTFDYGLNASAKEFDGKNKYIRITDIDDASREFLLSDLSSPDICLDGMSKYLLSSGDIVFARTGASVGKTYIYRENDGIVYFAGFLIRAKVNQDNDAEFVFQSTLSPGYEKYIHITSQRSGQPGVNAQEYGEYDLFAPSKEEQQRIGHFLRGIDNLITLHQRKPFLMKWRTSDANRNQTNRLVL